MVPGQSLKTAKTQVVVKTYRRRSLEIPSDPNSPMLSLKKFIRLEKPINDFTLGGKVVMKKQNRPSRKRRNIIRNNSKKEPKGWWLSHTSKGPQKLSKGYSRDMELALV